MAKMDTNLEPVTRRDRLILLKEIDMRKVALDVREVPVEVAQKVMPKSKRFILQATDTEQKITKRITFLPVRGKVILAFSVNWTLKRALECSEDIARQSWTIYKLAGYKN